jgi:hypothetical protein
MTTHTYKFEIKVGKPKDIQLQKASMYPFDKLAVGTYFEVPSDHPAASKNSAGAPRISSAAYTYQKQSGAKMSVRRLPDGSCRVYRIA